MTQSDSTIGPGDRDAVLAVYSVLGARRTSFDTVMWQVPALAMAAQAFLLATSLDSGASRAWRIIAAALGLFLAWVSMQLMAKLRSLEIVDSRTLERIEIGLHIDTALGFAPHAHVRERIQRSPQRAAWWMRVSSFRLWIVVLGLLGAADVGAVAYAIWT